MQRCSPAAQVGVMQLPDPVELHSAAVAQVVDVSVCPSLLQRKSRLFEQRAVPAVQLSHCPLVASHTFGHTCDWSAWPSLLQWFSVVFVQVFELGVQMSHWPPAASQRAALAQAVLTQLFWSLPHFCRVAPLHMTCPRLQIAQ